MENQSDLYHNQYEAWIYDQLEPDERLHVGWVSPRAVPSYAVPFPEYLIKCTPEQITELQLQEREDDFLRKHGI